MSVALIMPKCFQHLNSLSYVPFEVSKGPSFYDYFNGLSRLIRLRRAVTLTEARNFADSARLILL